MAKTHDAALDRLNTYLAASKNRPGSGCALWDPHTGQGVSLRSLRLVAELAARAQEQG